jgi:spectrin beta
MFTAIKKWADEKLAYLNTKEDISSSEPARQHLSLMDALRTAFQGQTESNVPALKKLGGEIRAAKYETQYSKWVYEKPEEVTQLETTVDSLWVEIKDKSAHKQKVLEDDLAREIFKVWMRCLAWCKPASPLSLKVAHPTLFRS